MFFSEKQECIPVGCVLAAAVAVGGGSASVHAGIDSYQVWAWRPPLALSPQLPLVCAPGGPPGQIHLNFPLGCGPEYPFPLARTTSISPWVWTWKTTRHAGIPPPLGTCCKACWDTTCNAFPPVTESQTRVKI